MFTCEPPGVKNEKAERFDVYITHVLCVRSRSDIFLFKEHVRVRRVRVVSAVTYSDTWFNM